MSAQQLITDHLDLWTGAVTHKRSAGRGSSGKGGKVELTGIKKLRELILELAVRGKLVEQDPTDEPASVLLEKIAEEKALLVEGGKIKKPKEAWEVAKDNLTQLPETWRWVALGELVSIMDAGWSPACPPEPAPESGWGVLKTTSVQVMSYFQQENKRLPEGKEPKRQYEVNSGDILITRAGPKNRVGISCWVDKTRPRLMISDKIIRFHLIDAAMSGPFICLCLNAGLTSQCLENAKSGMAESQMNISQDKLKVAPIPLCPVNEQHRIVAKVDELMALCDRLEQQVGDQLEAREVLVDTLLDALTRAADAIEVAEQWARLAEHFDTLFTSEASIDKLKQTILQLAVMGRLVEQDPNDEPASVLLEKIAGEKAQLVKEGKSKKTNKLPEITEEEKPFYLPDRWTWTRLGNITAKIGSGATPRGGKNAYTDTGIPFLRSQNVWNDGLALEEVAHIPLATHERMANTHVSPNDILLNITGASLGRCTIVPESLPEANVSQHVTIIRTTTSANRAYLHMLILSPYVQGLIWGRQVGMAREGLSKKVLELFEIPIPPEKEQHRIVSKADELMALCNQLKARLSEANITRSQLAISIIEQGASGDH